MMQPANLTSLSPAERKELQEWLNGREDAPLSDYLRYLRWKGRFVPALKLIRDNNPETIIKSINEKINADRS